MVFKRILRSNLMWRLSGITYITSAIATAWSFMRLRKYIEVSKRNMLPLKNYFNDNTVLEFGCGLGRNLIVVSNSIKNGDGIDVNSGFIKIAMCIQNRIGISNLKFYNYDVVHFPDIDKVDLIFENGGFERISPEMVKNYMTVLKEKYLKEQGLMILYFLTERAKNTEFTKRLGNSAYIFENHDAIIKLLGNLELTIMDFQEWTFADVFIVKKRNVA